MSKVATIINAELKANSGKLETLFHYMKSAYGAFGRELAEALVEHASGLTREDIDGEGPTLSGADDKFASELLADVAHDDILTKASTEALEAAMVALAKEHDRRTSSTVVSEVVKPQIGPTDV